MKKFCHCGYGIWLSQEQNGHKLVTVYHDDGEDCEEKETCFDVVTHCPRCKVKLIERELDDRNSK